MFPLKFFIFDDLRIWVTWVARFCFCFYFWEDRTMSTLSNLLLQAKTRSTNPSSFPIPSALAKPSLIGPTLTRGVVGGGRGDLVSSHGARIWSIPYAWRAWGRFVKSHVRSEMVALWEAEGLSQNPSCGWSYNLRCLIFLRSPWGCMTLSSIRIRAGLGSSSSCRDKAAARHSDHANYHHSVEMTSLFWQSIAIWLAMTIFRWFSLLIVLFVLICDKEWVNACWFSLSNILDFGGRWQLRWKCRWGWCTMMHAIARPTPDMEKTSSLLLRMDSIGKYL